MRGQANLSALDKITTGYNSFFAGDDGFPKTPEINVSRLTGLQKAEAAKAIKSQANSPQNRGKKNLEGEGRAMSPIGFNNASSDHNNE